MGLIDSPKSLQPSSAIDSIKFNLSHGACGQIPHAVMAMSLALALASLPCGLPLRTILWHFAVPTVEVANLDLRRSSMNLIRFCPRFRESRTLIMASRSTLLNIPSMSSLHWFTSRTRMLGIREKRWKKGIQTYGSIIICPSVGWFHRHENEDHPRYPPVPRDIKKPEISVVNGKQLRENYLFPMLNISRNDIWSWGFGLKLMVWKT